MNTRRAAMAGLIFAATSLALGGCGSLPESISSIEVQRSWTTSGTLLVSGYGAPLSKFAPSDTIYFYVELSWPDIAFSKGRRVIEWHWVKDGQVMAQKTAHYLMESSPFKTRTYLAASALGSGPVTVEAYMDGKRLASAQFVIEP